LSLLLLLYEVTFFPNTTCKISSTALLISRFLKDLAHVSQSMSSHKSVSPINCPTEISNTICDGPSSCFKNKKLYRPRNSIVSVICCPDFLPGKAILHCSYENCFFFSSFLMLPLALLIHKRFSGQECLLAIQWSCSFTNFIIFNLKLTVDEFSSVYYTFKK